MVAVVRIFENVMIFANAFLNPDRDWPMQAPSGSSVHLLPWIFTCPSFDLLCQVSSSASSQVPVP
jgi:hypothetical protein